MYKILKKILPYLIIMLSIILINLFVASPIKVKNISMYPTLNENDILILNKIDKNFKRFDIVVINSNNTQIIKRIIGLPGENIEYNNNILYINGIKTDDIINVKTEDFALKKIYETDKLPSDCYFVMGDNRIKSNDSRDSNVGLIKKSDIVGVVEARIYPFNKINKLR